MVLSFFCTLLWAQEATYKQYSPDPNIKNCDDLLTSHKQLTIDQYQVSQLPDSPAKQTRGKEVYIRNHVLQSTKDHLQSKGVLDQECQNRMRKQHLEVMSQLTGAISAENAQKNSQVLDLQQKLMSCMKECSSTSGGDSDKIKACMKGCQEEAQKLMPQEK